MMSPIDASPIDAALHRLARLHPRKIDLGLDRILRVLKVLGNPHEKLGTTVHIAGTNGKGSTTAFLKAMAEADGRSVNVYTSPHLVAFNERIAVHGTPISDDQLIASLNAVEAANDGQPLSFFEATTAAMFHAFAQHPADLTLIEVGLGGRYDATNVITPDVSIITPVALDHAEFLGRDLAGVAREKAGIIKENVPAVFGPQTDTALTVLDAQAATHNAPTLISGQDFRAYAQHGRLVFEASDTVLDLPAPSLYGDHQYANAGTAIAAARLLNIPEAALAKGLTGTVWPARMQNLTSGVFADMVTESGGELWLDGGHNPHAALALASHMATREAASPRPLILVMGILANKNAGAFLDAFEGLASGLVALSIPGHSSLAPETLSELATHRGIVPSIAANLTDAVARAIGMGEALSRQTVDQPVIPPRILICGSLYLAGDVLKQTGNVPE